MLSIAYAYVDAFRYLIARTLDTHHLSRRGAALFRVGAGLPSISSICLDTFLALRGAGDMGQCANPLLSDGYLSRMDVIKLYRYTIYRRPFFLFT